MIIIETVPTTYGATHFDVFQDGAPVGRLWSHPGSTTRIGGEAVMSALGRPKDVYKPLSEAVIRKSMN